MLTTTQHITNTKKRWLLPLLFLLGRLSCAAEVAEIMLLPLEDGGGVTDDDDDGSILFFAIVTICQLRDFEIPPSLYPPL